MSSFNEWNMLLDLKLISKDDEYNYNHFEEKYTYCNWLWKYVYYRMPLIRKRSFTIYRIFNKYIDSIGFD